MKNFTQIENISIHTKEGIDVINKDEISYMEAAGSYTIIHFKDKSKKLISKNTKCLLHLIKSQYFLRIHRSRVINILFIKSYKSHLKKHVEMQNGIKIPVSRSKRKMLTKTLLKVFTLFILVNLF